MGIEGALAILLIFGSIPAIVIYITWRRSQERIEMEMIRKGLDPILYRQMKVPKMGDGELKGGMLVTAIGIGCAISATLIQRYYDRDMMTVATVFITVGVSMLLYWAITRKEREKAQQIYERQIEKLLENNPQELKELNQ